MACGSFCGQDRLAGSSFAPAQSAWVPRPQAGPSCRGRAGRRRGPAAPRALFGKGDGKNPFGDMGKLMESIGKAQELVKQETFKLDQELKAAEFEGYNEDETVRVVVSGVQMAKSVDITEDALEKGVEHLQEAVLAAMQEALTKSRETQEQRMRDMSKMFGLPGQAG